MLEERDRQDHQGIMGIKEVKVWNMNWCPRLEAIYRYQYSLYRRKEQQPYYKHQLFYKNTYKIVSTSKFC